MTIKIPSGQKRFEMLELRTIHEGGFKSRASRTWRFPEVPTDPLAVAEDRVEDLPAGPQRARQGAGDLRTSRRGAGTRPGTSRVGADLRLAALTCISAVQPKSRSAIPSSQERGPIGSHGRAPGRSRGRPYRAGGSGSEASQLPKRAWGSRAPGSRLPESPASRPPGRRPLPSRSARPGACQLLGVVAE